MTRLLCAVLGHDWLHLTDHQDTVRVFCKRCGAYPVWRPLP